MSTKSRQPYKTQELLALRDSVSETAVTLEKFGDDDAIKGKFIFVHLKKRLHEIALPYPKLWSSDNIIVPNLSLVPLTSFFALGRMLWIRASLSAQLTLSICKVC
jgi:hypothetical protein